MIVAGTGHRPGKLGGYGTEAARKTYSVAEQWLLDRTPDVVISGMAIGWDQALASAAIGQGIELWAYVPFPGQDARWPMQSRKLYEWILERAGTVRYVTDHFTRNAFQARNEAMVDNADIVLALWNGDSEGGTFNCVQYATKKDKVIINLWEKFNDIKPPDA